LILPKRLCSQVGLLVLFYMCKLEAE